MTHDTHDLGAADFQSSFPAGAAHSASDVDDYDGAAPEGFAIAFLGWLATLGVVGLALWAKFA
jgi:hypothetical protein